jgi:hypothetical protein
MGIPAAMKDLQSRTRPISSLAIGTAIISMGNFPQEQS